MIIRSNLNKRVEDNGYDVMYLGHKKENGEKRYRAECRGKGKRRECGYRLQSVIKNTLQPMKPPGSIEKQ